MAIRLGSKGQTIGGVQYGAYDIVTSLPPAVEQALVQGGDAVALGALGIVPAFFDASTRELILPDGSRVAVGSGGGAVLAISAPGGKGTGAVLTALPSPGFAITAYQWTRNDVAIVAAAPNVNSTSSTYTLVAADAGQLIGCRVSLGSTTFTAYVTAAAAALPAGYLSLSGGVLSLGSAVLSLA